MACWPLADLACSPFQCSINAVGLRVPSLLKLVTWLKLDSRRICKKVCARRESNPGHKHGRLVWCRYTTCAMSRTALRTFGRERFFPYRYHPETSISRLVEQEWVMDWFKAQLLPAYPAILLEILLIDMIVDAQNLSSFSILLFGLVTSKF